MAVSTLTLSTFYARASQMLNDSGNIVYSVNLVTEGSRLALHDYTIAYPQEKVAAITLVAAGREHVLTSAADLIRLVRVWYPYTAANPEYPPNWVPFQLFWTAGVPTLFLDIPSPASIGQAVRIFYHARQALKDLDSAAATTFSQEHESLLVTGAAGYSAIARANELDRMVTAPPSVATTVRNWGELRLSEFRVGLTKGAHFWRTS